MVTDITPAQFGAKTITDHQRFVPRHSDEFNSRVPPVAAEQHWPDIILRCESSTDNSESHRTADGALADKGNKMAPSRADSGDPVIRVPSQQQRFRRPQRHSAILSTFGTISGSLTSGSRRRAGTASSCSPSGYAATWSDPLHGSHSPMTATMLARIAPRAASDQYHRHLVADTHCVQDPSHRHRSTADDCISRPSNCLLGRQSRSITCLQDLENGNGPMLMSPPAASAMFGRPLPPWSNNKRSSTFNASDVNYDSRIEPWTLGCSAVIRRPRYFP